MSSHYISTTLMESKCLEKWLTNPVGLSESASYVWALSATNIIGREAEECNCSEQSWNDDSADRCVIFATIIATSCVSLFEGLCLHPPSPQSPTCHYRLGSSDVVFPEKYFVGNFPENFWKFSGNFPKKRKIFIKIKYTRERVMSLSISMCVHLCTTLIL